MPPKKTVLLVIEDETPLRHALVDKCTRAGITVLEANNGESGLQMALLKHPDVILLDILLPDRDGLSVLSELRRDEWGKDAKVMILSNVEQTTRVAKALESQTFEYFVKSDIDIGRIVEIIQSHLGLEVAKK